jgi:hypothetical protein
VDDTCLWRRTGERSRDGDRARLIKRDTHHVPPAERFGEAHGKRAQQGGLVTYGRGRLGGGIAHIPVGGLHDDLFPP